MPATDFTSAGQVRNGSEFPVPNSSKFGGGRPAVMSDEQLLSLAGELNARLGRPPRADELITESGGCQRKRALAAIRQLKLDLAQRTVHSQLVFPAPIEAGMRALMAQWLQQASQQLAASQLEVSERTERCQVAQRALIDEFQQTTATLKQQIADRDRLVSEFRRRIGDLECDLATAREQCLLANSTAEERLRLLTRFEAIAGIRSESAAGGNA